MSALIFTLDSNCFLYNGQKNALYLFFFNYWGLNFVISRNSEEIAGDDFLPGKTFYKQYLEEISAFINLSLVQASTGHVFFWKGEEVAFFQSVDGSL